MKNKKAIEIIGNLIEAVESAPIESDDDTERANYRGEIYRLAESFEAETGVSIDLKPYELPGGFRYVQKFIVANIQERGFFDRELEPLRRLRARLEQGLPIFSINTPDESAKLTEKEAKVLGYLAKTPDLKQYQPDIESGTDISRKTISKILDSLHSKGLAVKHRRGVTITPEGLKRTQ